MMRFAVLFACVLASANALKCTTGAVGGVKWSAASTSAGTATCSTGQCVAAKYVYSGGNCGALAPMLAAGCADQSVAANSDSLTTGKFSKAMCDAGSATIAAAGGKPTMNVVYQCSTTTALKYTDAAGIFVFQPGQDKYLCNGCKDSETREEKSVLTAFLLQFFLGQFSAGLFYYEIMGLGAAFLCMNIAPCFACCALAAIFGCGALTAMAGRGGDGGAPADNDEAVALETVEGSGTGTGSGAGSGGDGEKGGVPAMIIMCCCSCISLGGNVCAFVFMILIAVKSCVPDEEKFCIKPM